LDETLSSEKGIIFECRGIEFLNFHADYQGRARSAWNGIFKKPTKRKIHGRIPARLKVSAKIFISPQSDYPALIKAGSSVTLTSYVQGLALLAFADIVGNLALHSGVVQVASGIMNNHLRRVIPDHLFLVDEPPERRQNPAYPALEEGALN